MFCSSVELRPAKSPCSVYLAYCPKDQCYRIVDDCHYTCHPQCRELVTLDCNASASSQEKEIFAEQNDVESVPASSNTSQETETVAEDDDDGLACPDPVVPISEVSQLPLLAEEQGPFTLIGEEHRSATLPSKRSREANRFSPRHTGSIQSSTGSLPRRETANGASMAILRSALRERGLTVADLSTNLFLGDWEEDGANFRGFIRVHMNLCRPISVVAGTRPPSIYDILKEDSSLERTLTSFYLPRDTIKALHITSSTTTSQVIAALLKKFKVVDNPRKFALYERYYEDGETAKVKMRRIADNETPLNLALRWSREENCNKMFVMQENDTGDILWEAFSLPELGNFLRILDREEEEYKRQVRMKYQLLAEKIRETMEQLSPSPKTEVSDSPESPEDEQVELRTKS